MKHRKKTMAARIVQYGDWRYLKTNDTDDMAKQLLALTESLLGTVERHGMPLRLQWFVNGFSADRSPLFRESFGWKGSFPRLVTLNTPHD